jgi:hypothetical protein
MLKFSNAERIIKFLYALQLNEKVLKAEIVSLKRQVKFLKQNCYCPEHISPPHVIETKFISTSNTARKVTS